MSPLPTINPLPSTELISHLPTSMGIKGLYEELGAPDKVPLAKLSIDHFKKHKRHIRVAIDISIWAFQSKAVQGRSTGSNAPLRVIYYRLCSLLSLNIHAVFVFDGKDRPEFKRGKSVSGGEGYLLAFSRRLITAFGFPIHNAPGEAEAECAYLQKQGIVDAVLSEDVDTLMFGCRQSWRSCEKGDSKTLEIMQVYKSRVIRDKTGLTPAGMVLTALLSGGDYNTAGVAGIGMKQAVAAAKAGFGDELLQACKLEASDGGHALQLWRQKLETNLRTNSNKIFSRKQPKAKIPGDFPDPKIVNYYINPMISKTPPQINWNICPNLEALREITKAKFEWTGSGKLIRTLSEKLLSWQLGHNQPGSDSLVLSIHQRISGLKDGMPDKLRVTFTPILVVPLPYNHEEDNVYTRSVPTVDAEELLDDPNGYTDSDKEDIRVNGVAATKSTTGKPDRSRVEYDPRSNQRIWIYEQFVAQGANGHIQLWDDNEARKKAAKLKQAEDKLQKSSVRKAKKKTTTTSNQPTIQSFFHQKKNTVKATKHSADRLPVSGLEPNNQKENSRIVIDLDSVDRNDGEGHPDPNDSQSKENHRGNNGRMKLERIVTRPSLPGAWKLTDNDENALCDVSIYDLTNDDPCLEL
ncbi:hypothetical protein TWF679_001088 [Orbilia oligospora]|uniref:XPG-I domain-containing protein n=1 Tax=Orbilia oligospora TaxID=2813651 RepID=A0A8H8UWF5_ORBOL|nr:hypothetical protein TWF679_001088 [Orbilia oligospora]